MKRRVVITGMGVINSVAKSLPEFDAALRDGKSGVKDVTIFDVSPYAFRAMGEISGLDDIAPTLDRASVLALRSAESAIADAGREVLEGDKRVGVVIGTTCGGVTTHEAVIQKQGAGGEPDLTELNEIPFSVMANHIAQQYELTGPVATVTTACASGSNAIGYAAELVRSGRADVMLAGGSDCVSRFTFSGFSSLRAMTREACRPFDSGRTGIVLGEGAAIVVLEDLDAAVARGARIYAEVLGYGYCNDAYHSTAPDPRGGGMLRSIGDALAATTVSRNQIDYINAHGTGTLANDSMELAAYQQLLGDRVARVPLSSIKAMIGHTLGAAGAVELVATVLGLNGQYVPPTINSLDPPSSVEFDIVPNRSRAASLRYALCCNAGFAGHNAAVLLGQVGGDVSSSSPASGNRMGIAS